MADEPRQAIRGVSVTPRLPPRSRIGRARLARAYAAANRRDSELVLTAAGRREP